MAVFIAVETLMLPSFAFRRLALSCCVLTALTFSFSLPAFGTFQVSFNIHGIQVADGFRVVGVVANVLYARL